MLISIEQAALHLELSENFFFQNRELKSHLVKKDNRVYIENSLLVSWQQKREKEQFFCIDMVIFAEYVISKIGDDAFYQRLDLSYHQNIKYNVKHDLKVSKLTYPNAQKIRDTFWKEFGEAFSSDSEKGKLRQSFYTPKHLRKPLTRGYIKRHYWKEKKLVADIAEDLNVPQTWVQSEIRRLGMQKRDNGISLRGAHFTADEHYKKVRQNQPHRKAVVRIDPYTFKSVREYRSIASVEEDGYRRENVRRAIKIAGIHKGYLWAEKGMEEPIIRSAKKRGNLERKLSASLVVKPSKEELKKLYIDQNLTLNEVGDIIGCSRNAIASYAKEYGLRKDKPKIDMKELRRLYLEEGMSTKELAKKYNRKISSIRTYLCKNGIKKKYYVFKKEKKTTKDKK